MLRLNIYPSKEPSAAGTDVSVFFLSPDGGNQESSSIQITLQTLALIGSRHYHVVVVQPRLLPNESDEFSTLEASGPAGWPLSLIESKGCRGVVCNNLKKSKWLSASAHFKDGMPTILE